MKKKIETAGKKSGAFKFSSPSENTNLKRIYRLGEYQQQVASLRITRQKLEIAEKELTELNQKQVKLNKKVDYYEDSRKQIEGFREELKEQYRKLEELLAEKEELAREVASLSERGEAEEMEDELKREINKVRVFEKKYDSFQTETIKLQQEKNKELEERV